MNSPIHVTVAAIVERDSRYLLVEERIDGRLVLNQPAGHVEQGESLLDAVVRETAEETGHKFEPKGFLGVYRWQAPGGETFMRFAFIGDIDRPIGGKLDPVIERVLWLGLAEIMNETSRLRSPLVLAVIADHQRGNAYPLDCLKDLNSATL